MRAVVQRVSEASVEVGGQRHSAIGPGLLVYLGIRREDGAAEVAYLVEKIRYLRLFSDTADKMNLDVVQAGGSCLVVSAFTVQGDARKGRRPSFDTAAEAHAAAPLYDHFCAELGRTGVPIATGSFGSNMRVASINAGPVCILLDSQRAF